MQRSKHHDQSTTRPGVSLTLFWLKSTCCVRPLGGLPRCRVAVSARPPLLLYQDPAVHAMPAGLFCLKKPRTLNLHAGLWRALPYAPRSAISGPRSPLDLRIGVWIPLWISPCSLFQQRILRQQGLRGTMLPPGMASVRPVVLAWIRLAWLAGLGQPSFHVLLICRK